MKRPKPDSITFEAWVASSLKRGEQLQNTARGLWRHWSRYADSLGAEKGTPRSFSNELRKMGFPWSRPLAESPRTRFHHGIAVDIPLDRSPPPPGLDERTWRDICVEHYSSQQELYR